IRVGTPFEKGEKVGGPNQHPRGCAGRGLPFPSLFGLLAKGRPTVVNPLHPHEARPPESCNGPAAGAEEHPHVAQALSVQADAGGIPHNTWMVYQLMFAIITPALICGAYAERMKFSSMVLFSVGWLLLIYCPMAHMVWGKGGLFNAFVADSKMNVPALDFAGG